MGKNKIFFSIVALAFFYFCVDSRVKCVKPNCDHYDQWHGKPIGDADWMCMSFPAPPFDSLANLTLKGDKDAYREMLWYYEENYFDMGAASLYTFLMCHKYNYFNMYPYFYMVMDCKAKCHRIRPDMESVNMSLRYLLQGAEFNNNIYSWLAEIYLEGKYVDRDTVMGRGYSLKAYGKSAGEEYYKRKMEMWEESHMKHMININKKER